MNAPERISTVPAQDRVTDTSSQPKEEKMPANQPARARRERRFEVGFFVRKVVNGWLEYYKQFPPQRQPVSGLEPPPEEVVDQASGSRESRAFTLARSRSGAADDTVHAQDGLGPGGGDPGPVGSTRVEFGFFVGTTTETTDEES